jgi:tetratricopeptide (TPR) repeat protein
LCLQLASVGCGPYGESNVYTLNRITYNGTRTTLGPAFGQSNTITANIANSNYNSFQASVERKASDVTFLLAHTFSKAIDNSSGFNDWVNFSNHRLNRALSSYDVTHNFIASYNWAVPFDRWFSGGPRRLTQGWNFVGISRFSTGFPITMGQSVGDLSLTGDSNNDAAALREFQQAARLMPRNPIALCDLGLALKENGDTQGAIATLRRAVELKADFERAKYALGVALQRHGQTAEAASEMREIRKLHQSLTELAQSKELIFKGVEQMKEARWQDAKARFEESAKLSPNLPPSYYYLGQSEAKLGDTHDALEAYRKALRLGLTTPWRIWLSEFFMPGWADPMMGSAGCAKRCSVTPILRTLITT